MHGNSHFFSHRHDATRALHSFPTRRSSDLELRRVHTFPLEAVVVADWGLVFRTPNHLVLPDLHVPPLLQPEERPADERVVDRKSTRLNSSHRTISYAVFCLKKKKKMQISVT